MATLGPTATTADVSTSANFASWAGTGTFGINTALSGFGWTRTSDQNQIQWGLTPTAVPYTGNPFTTYPLPNMPQSANYSINARGNWVTGTNYAVGDVVFDTTTNSSYYCFLAIINSTTVPSSDTTHFFVYHYEIWQTNDVASFSQTSQSVSYTASVQTLTIATTTSPNRLKAGFNVTISGATNLPQINGTWCVSTASPTALTFVIPNSVTGFAANFSGTDSFTVTYNLQPICMKLEYFGNTAIYTAAPWTRVSFGNGTDGLGNLSGNVVGSTNAGPNITAAAGTGGWGFLPLDLMANGSSPAGAQTSSIWRCIASGSAGRFGTCLWYNRNDTNAANSNSYFWIVERAKDNNGNDIDDYFTYIAGCLGINGQSAFGAIARTVQQRSILRWNPVVNITQVQISSNQLTITYSSKMPYQFAIGAIVYIGGLTSAAFLNGQLLQVVSVTTNTVTMSFTNANYGPALDTGTLQQSTSLTSFTPIAGTGYPCACDNNVCTIQRSLTSLTFNGLTPLLPVFPVPGFLGNPMTMAMSLANGDAPAHDTTATIPLYGASRTYYFPQGSTVSAPYTYFGDNSATYNLALRWD